jgi:hypothetical protein
LAGRCPESSDGMVAQQTNYTEVDEARAAAQRFAEKRG